MAASLQRAFAFEPTSGGARRPPPPQGVPGVGAGGVRQRPAPHGSCHAAADASGHAKRSQGAGRRWPWARRPVGVHTQPVEVICNAPGRSPSGMMAPAGACRVIEAKKRIKPIAAPGLRAGTRQPSDLRQDQPPPMAAPMYSPRRQTPGSSEAAGQCSNVAAVRVRAAGPPPPVAWAHRRQRSLAEPAIAGLQKMRRRPIGTAPAPAAQRRLRLGLAAAAPFSTAKLPDRPPMTMFQLRGASDQHRRGPRRRRTRPAEDVERRPPVDHQPAAPTDSASMRAISTSQARERGRRHWRRPREGARHQAVARPVVLVEGAGGGRGAQHRQRQHRHPPRLARRPAWDRQPTSAVTMMSTPMRSLNRPSTSRATMAGLGRVVPRGWSCHRGSSAQPSGPRPARGTSS